MHSFAYAQLHSACLTLGSQLVHGRGFVWRLYFWIFVGFGLGFMPVCWWEGSLCFAILNAWISVLGSFVVRFHWRVACWSGFSFGILDFICGIAPLSADRFAVFICCIFWTSEQDFRTGHGSDFSASLVRMVVGGLTGFWYLAVWMRMWISASVGDMIHKANLTFLFSWQQFLGTRRCLMSHLAGGSLVLMDNTTSGKTLSHPYYCFVHARL